SKTPGISVEPEPAMGVRAGATGTLSFDEVRVSGAALLGEGDPEIFKHCVQLARLAWCSLAVGTGQAVLDYVIPYVNERTAFGEPIANRQAVSFMVANIAIELDGMRLATYRAASRADQGKPFGREVALARRLCAERGMQIGSDGVQLLGGHGYVKEHPVERWYRDLRAAGVMEGALLGGRRAAADDAPPGSWSSRDRRGRQRGTAEALRRQVGSDGHHRARGRLRLRRGAHHGDARRGDRRIRPQRREDLRHLRRS